MPPAILSPDLRRRLEALAPQIGVQRGTALFMKVDSVGEFLVKRLVPVLVQAVYPVTPLGVREYSYPTVRRGQGEEVGVRAEPILLFRNRVNVLQKGSGAGVARGRRPLVALRAEAEDRFAQVPFREGVPGDELAGPVPALVDGPERPVDLGDLASTKRLHRLLDRGWEENVVSVQEENHLPPAGPHSCVEGGRLASVLFQQRDDPARVPCN